MNTVMVRTQMRKYPFLVSEGLLDQVGNEVRDRLETRRVVVVADSRASVLHGERLRTSLDHAGLTVAHWLEFPRGEKAKSLTRIQDLYRIWIDHGVDRWTPVIAFGGGVVGDVVGFAASSFYRGIPLVHVPTTVVAQVDSSIGGKTAVNYAGAKNLIGSFYQPHLVLADPSCLTTLSPRDFRAGMAEVVKIAVTLRPDLMERLESRVEAVGARQPQELVPVIQACAEAKAEVVGRDETDQDVRSILNYCHTLGHALESSGRGRLRHGEAVAIGMNAATVVGQVVGVTPSEVAERQNGLLQRLGLKLTAPWADKEEVARNLKLDKKVRDQNCRFVLTLQIGGASVWPDIPVGPIQQAIQAVTK